MLIKFPSCEDTLDEVSKSLDCSAILTNDQLDSPQFKLRSIAKRFFSEDATSPYPKIKQEEDLQATLIKERNDLSQRKEVVEFAQVAEDLANDSPFLEDEELNLRIDELKKRISTFTDNHLPSRKDMKILRLANSLLSKAASREPAVIKDSKKISVIPFKHHSPEEISLDDFGLAETLYEIAHLLYNGDYPSFKSAFDKNLSTAAKKEISFHIHNCDGNITEYKTKKARIAIIKGMLGFAHTITDYYAGETPYPTTKEIENLFSAEIY